MGGLRVLPLLVPAEGDGWGSHRAPIQVLGDTLEES